ncbi:MAG: hypothetical protein WCK06_10435 [Actinomycetota bacterium]
MTNPIGNKADADALRAQILELTALYYSAACGSGSAVAVIAVQQTI